MGRSYSICTISKVQQLQELQPVAATPSIQRKREAIPDTKRHTGRRNDGDALRLSLSRAADGATRLSLSMKYAGPCRGRGCRGVLRSTNVERDTAS